MLPNIASQSGQKGFAYLWMLLTLVLLSLGLGKSIEIHHLKFRREKELELLYIGSRYQQAIRSYYYSSPGSRKHLPRTLDDLLLDSRLLAHKRHIRRLYSDPITGGNEWGLIVSPEGGILGIYPLSSEMPIKQDNFPSQFASFSRAPRYSMWQFTFNPPKVQN